MNQKAAKAPPSPPGAGAQRAGQSLSPRSFSERDLQAAVLDLVKRKNTDRATKLLIEQLPLLYASKLNIKEKLNNLMFLTRIIQDGGGSKYGYRKLRTKVKALADYLKEIELPAGGFIELGCGAHDPISLSTYFYLNGLTPAVGIDLLPPRTSHYSALSMYDILANVKMFPGRYTWRGIKPHEVLTRLREIDVAAFERGDFDAGLDSFQSDVRIVSEDFLTCDIVPSSVALLTSYAVLEHVGDIDAIMRRSYELLAPGGVAYHFIDLADHRSYRGDGSFGPLSFLTEADAPANMNRLRAPEMTAAAVAAGFELVKDDRNSAPLTPDIRAALVERFAEMSIEDVAVVKQHLVLRKPSDDQAT